MLSMRALNRNSWKMTLVARHVWVSPCNRNVSNNYLLSLFYLEHVIVIFGKATYCFSLYDEEHVDPNNQIDQDMAIRLLIDEKYDVTNNP